MTDGQLERKRKLEGQAETRRILMRIRQHRLKFIDEDLEKYYREMSEKTLHGQEIREAELEKVRQREGNRCEVIQLIEDIKAENAELQSLNILCKAEGEK